MSMTIITVLLLSASSICIGASFQSIQPIYADGLDFKRTKNLSNNDGNSNFPRIAVSGNNVYVVWSDEIERSGDLDILFKRSADGGKTFERTKNLSNNPALIRSTNPQIAASGNNVYVAWTDSTPGSPGNRDVSFKRSTDRGDDFDRTKNLSNNGESFDPQIAASGNNVYVAWTGFTQGNLEILFKRSTDRGHDFDRTKNLSNNAGLSEGPRISVFGNNVYVVWRDLTPGNLEILFKRSTDRGHDFDRTKNLSNDADISSDPQIAISGNNVYVAWTDSTPGNFDILFKRSTDRGHDFDRTKNLSNDADISFGPQIAISGNNVYVAWIDFTNFDILFKRSTDRGHDFDRTKNLSDNDRFSSEPHIAASGNNVYVAWTEFTPNFEILDILFKRSTDRGHDFDRTKNLNNNADISFDPQIAASGNKVYVVWFDNTPGNFDVFFRRGTQ